MLGFKRGGVGYVLIKTDSIHEHTINLVGENGQKLISDVTYLPQQRTRVYGTVIQTPVEMGMGFVSMSSPGVPGYGAIRTYNHHDMETPHPAFYKIGGTTQYKFMHDIFPDVEINDLIYFKWPALAKKNLVAESRGEPKEFLFKIPYDQIICVVRDGKIIPIATHVLVDPERETFRDILAPTFYPTPGPDGQPVPRPESEWIMKKAFPENKPRQGTIAHVGKPFRGDLPTMQEGMKVLLKLNIKNLYTIEGREYIVIPQSKILAKID
jgi:hypothetical protein